MPKHNFCLEYSSTKCHHRFKKWIGAVNAKPFLEPMMMFSRSISKKMISKTDTDSVTKIRRCKIQELFPDLLNNFQILGPFQGLEYYFTNLRTFQGFHDLWEPRVSPTI